MANSTFVVSHLFEVKSGSKIRQIKDKKVGRKGKVKKKNLVKVEKGDRSGESSVVPMVQRMSYLSSHG